MKTKTSTKQKTAISIKPVVSGSATLGTTKEELITAYEKKVSLANERRNIAHKNNLDWGVDMADREIEKLSEFIEKLKNLDLSAAMSMLPEVKPYAWISVDERLPDDSSYHLVAWRLPSPDGNSFVQGSRSAMYEIDKEWYGEDGIKVNAITHWTPFLKPPHVGK